jgi:hypothetical protein
VPELSLYFSVIKKRSFVRRKLMGYIKRNVKTYLYTYDEVIRDVESDTILETHTGTIEIDSTKKNPYEDFWKWAADRRKLFAKNERNQGKSIYIEAVTVEDEEKTNVKDSLDDTQGSYEEE